jgi:hypothetical protein
MLHGIVVHSTLIAILLHGIMGCEWHHAHGATAAQGAHGLCGPADAGDCRADGRAHNHRHRHTAPQETVVTDTAEAPAFADGDRPGHPHDRCLEGECAYLLASQAAPPDPDQGLLQPAPVEPLAASLHGALLTGRGGFSLAPALAVLPYQPRCAVTQVWLI